MRFNRSTSIVQFMYLYTMVLSVTMDQYKKSLDVMRSTCEPKFPELPREVIDDFRTGKVPADVPRDLKVSETIGIKRLKSSFAVLC